MHFNLNQFLKISNRVAGPVLGALGVPPGVIIIAQHAIDDAEIASAAREVPLTGAEKKALVLDAVATGIAGANAAKPGSVDPLITPLVGRGIDLTVDTINQIHKTKSASVEPVGSVVSTLE